LSSASHSKSTEVVATEHKLTWIV